MYSLIAPWDPCPQFPLPPFDILDVHTRVECRMGKLGVDLFKAVEGDGFFLDFHVFLRVTSMCILI